MKVISGGQNGADQAGIEAAKIVGLKTGGWLPKGCRTLDGPRPKFLDLYQMQEHASASYARRTEANVRDSDGTIRFARVFSSAGEKCTLKAIKWFNKPDLKIDVDNLPAVEQVVSWIKQHNIQVLNIAGNSEQTAEGIGKIVREYLIQVFEALTNEK
jgi:hypothetical protein